jgi:hypothetical protein
MAAGLSVDLDRWRQEFDELMLRVGGRFARVEPRRRMAAFVRGLLAGLPRVNCWSIAEHAGDMGPRGMQRLLSAAVWDEAGVRDDLRGYARSARAPGGSNRRRGCASPCTIRAGTWIFGSSARMSTSALTVSVSSSTWRASPRSS